MNEDRTPQTPPIIKAVTDCESRPRWSVMIPAYNCIGYLQTALESVLIQDPGPEIMQIEVVDDHSTDGDVRALVARVGKGRVGYYRQPYNRGSLRNFETCLNRSKGHLVHLLHGDDAVLPGFYRVTGALFDAHPQVGAAFTSHIVIDECGNQVYSRQSLMDKPGVLSDWLSTIARRQRLQPPAIVVKRLVYEHLGGFFAFHFNEDWEMWVRIAAHYPVAYSPERLARYRYHTNNITTRSFLSGQNILDIYKAIDIIQHYLPPEKRKSYKRSARKYKSIYIAHKSHQLYNEYGTTHAALLQAKAAFKMSRNLNTIYIILKLYIKKLIGYKFLKKRTLRFFEKLKERNADSEPVPVNRLKE
ncbi:glycosyltransferase involved in cell wall biosynthesis [Anseongella ginsenosidimutans]|uniref:Glycosyltransferase involved in cell wall biosynthesis n=1 Tax=Anseongella ginsenosidimutans TaxID=496056 RepID=A0A4R3KZQ8_9SPHI|nr:glycosyltransferase [Anseongella ginsenosidimutans]TCS90120.1 glycosyltransferase involved in cell wall biosynthesis [Anseongella ginsenosidimutans]